MEHYLKDSKFSGPQMVLTNSGKTRILKFLGKLVMELQMFLEKMHMPLSSDLEQKPEGLKKEISLKTTTENPYSSREQL
jgi:hypothetical protein